MLGNISDFDPAIPAVWSMMTMLFEIDRWALEACRSS